MFWCLLVADNPAEHTSITAKELQYIESSVKMTSQEAQVRQTTRSFWQCYAHYGCVVSMSTVSGLKHLFRQDVAKISNCGLISCAYIKALLVLMLDGTSSVTEVGCMILFLYLLH